MSEYEHASSLDKRDLALHPLDVLQAQEQEATIEDDIENALEDGETYGEILQRLGGFEQVEGIVGTDYAKYLREQAVEELEQSLKQQPIESTEGEK